MAVVKAGNLVAVTAAGTTDLTNFKISHIVVAASGGAGVVELESTNGGGVIFRVDLAAGSTQHFPLTPAGISLPSLYVKTLTNAKLYLVIGGG